jgi:hypothetical protein
VGSPGIDSSGERVNETERDLLPLSYVLVATFELKHEVRDDRSATLSSVLADAFFRHGASGCLFMA